MKNSRIFFFAAMAAAAIAMTGCKDDTEPGSKPSDVQGLFINEVCSNPTDEIDWIELYNASGADIDLSGYHLQDDKGSEEEYTFPAGSKIASGEFYVLVGAKNNPDGGTFGFGISSGGDQLTLLDEAYAVIDQVVVPEMDTDFTYARTEDGGSEWEKVNGGTKGRSNSESPDQPGSDIPSGIDYSGLRLNELNGNDKFIELYNTSDTAIDITGCRIYKDAEKTVFTADGVTIEAHGFITLLSEDLYEGMEVPESTLIFTSGLSADKSVMIELLAPDGEQLDVFKNLSEALGETWGEDDGKYNSKDKEVKPSFARVADGTGDWYIMTSTQGKSNSDAEKVEDEKIVW